MDDTEHTNKNGAVPPPIAFKTNHGLFAICRMIGRAVIVATLVLLVLALISSILLACISPDILVGAIFSGNPALGP